MYCLVFWHKKLLQNSFFSWEDGGYEIYEEITIEWVERGLKKIIGIPVWWQLDIQEVLNSLMTKYYNFETDVKIFMPKDANKIIIW
jgi:hypothetical protein